MYDAAFYDMIRAGTRRSAAVVVPLLLKHLHPYSMIDVGGGEGWWAHEFAQHTVISMLLDGPAGLAGSPLPPGQRILHDLRDPLPLDWEARFGRFDLAVAVEVAEHLPPERAAGFVADLVRLAPVVVFSAAIPGQGGVGHLNEQWPDYWTALFAEHEYTVTGELRWQLWDDERVEVWYRQNLLVAAADPRACPDLFAAAPPTPVSVVHPILYNDRRRGRR